MAVRVQLSCSQQMSGLPRRKWPRPSWGGSFFFDEKILVKKIFFLLFGGKIDGGRGKREEGQGGMILQLMKLTWAFSQTLVQT